MKHTLYWFEHFNKNKDWNKIRFKGLNKGFNGYPRFDFPEHLIDIVDLPIFLTIEEMRLPLFIGTQFGRYPSLNYESLYAMKNHNVAVLGKSVLSGHVAGLAIGKLNNGGCERIIYFENMKPK